MCRVCGDSASTFHYGVLTCPDCMLFFQLSIKDDFSGGYSCKQKWHEITKKNRGRCEYCWYQKCIHVGMSTNKPKIGETVRCMKTEPQPQPQPQRQQYLQHQKAATQPSKVQSSEIGNKKNLSKPASNLKPQNSCKVCGDRAYKKHFGILTCPECEVFFRMSLMDDFAGGYSCQTKTCKIDKLRRSKCEYCWYQKCLASGMRDSPSTQQEQPQKGKTPQPMNLNNNSMMLVKVKQEYDSSGPQFAHPSTSRCDPAPVCTLQDSPSFKKEELVSSQCLQSTVPTQTVSSRISTGRRNEKGIRTKTKTVSMPPASAVTVTTSSLFSAGSSSSYPSKTSNSQTAVTRFTSNSVHSISMMPPKMSVQSKTSFFKTVSSMPASTSNEIGHICKVCGGRAVAKHFGIYACNACYNFIVMSLQTPHEEKYRCAYERKCSLGGRVSRRCPYCWSMKWFQVGQLTQYVLSDRLLVESLDATNTQDEVKTTSFNSVDRNRTKLIVDLCAVCGNRALISNFGVLTCPECHVFFQVSVQDDRATSYECYQKSNCKITSGIKKRCELCWYKKCLSAGMRITKCEPVISSPSVNTTTTATITANATSSSSSSSSSSFQCPSTTTNTPGLI